MHWTYSLSNSLLLSVMVVCLVAGFRLGSTIDEKQPNKTAKYAPHDALEIPRGTEITVVRTDGSYLWSTFLGVDTAKTDPSEGDALLLADNNRPYRIPMQSVQRIEAYSTDGLAKWIGLGSCLLLDLAAMVAFLRHGEKRKDLRLRVC